MYDRTKLYPEVEVIAYANLLLEQAGSNLRTTSSTFVNDRENCMRLSARTSAGGLVHLIAPLAVFPDGSMTFRSILRAPYRGGEINYLVNGQATGATKEVLFQGENGLRLIPSIAAIENHFRSSDPTQMRNPDLHAKAREERIDELRPQAPDVFCVALPGEDMRPLQPDDAAAPAP